MMRKRHYIILAIVAVGLLVCAAVVLRPRQLPLEECSQLYRDYADNPHVTVAFIKDFPVNDTLRVDVTTLQATTDSAWYALLQDFGAPEELIEMYKSDREFFEGKKAKVVTMFSIDKNNLRKRVPFNDPDSRIVKVSYEKMSLCVFNTENENIKKTIKSNEIINLKTKNDESEIQKIGTPHSADSGRCRLPERK